MTGDAWWILKGWARHGSQLQTQLYVNRRSDELTKSVLSALPDLAARKPTVTWVAPLESASFDEPQDAGFLRTLRFAEHEAELKAFWPKGGPVWDALARCTLQDGSTGALLAEGKNYPDEMYSTGSQVGSSASDRSRANKRQIEKAIGWAQEQLGLAVNTARWMEAVDAARPSSSLYQTANRIAHTLWLRSVGVDAWLCHLLFVRDTRFGHSTEDEWVAAIAHAEQLLGIDEAKIPFIGHTYLQALDVETVSRRGRGKRLASDLDEPPEGVREPHLLDRAAVGVQQTRARDQVREALRPRDRHVQAVAREEEVEPARDVVRARARQRIDHRRLLTLQLVHRAHAMSLAVGARSLRLVAVPLFHVGGGVSSARSQVLEQTLCRLRGRASGCVSRAAQAEGRGSRRAAARARSRAG
jgi:hypothetical protein